METNQEGAMEVEKKATIVGSHRTASGSNGGGDAMTAGDKGEAGKGKRFVPVSQKYIDMVLKEKATGTGAYKVSTSMERVEKHYKGPHDLRSLVARSNAAMEKVRAGDAKILEQYERLGCAYTEVLEDEGSDVIDEEKIRHYLSMWPPAS